MFRQSRGTWLFVINQLLNIFMQKYKKHFIGI